MSELIPRVTEIAAFWKVEDAAKKYLTLKIADGGLLTHDALSVLIGVPREQGEMSHSEGQRLQLERLKRTQLLFDHLLTSHQIALKSVHGVGYSQVPPNEQALLACRHLVKQIGKEFTRCLVMIKNTRTGALTSDESRRHSEAENKARGLQQMMKQGRRNILGFK